MVHVMQPKCDVDSKISGVGDAQNTRAPSDPIFLQGSSLSAGTLSSDSGWR